MQKTDFAFEVLVHDDVSTDNSAEIIHEYTEKYPQIFKPIYQTENQYSKGVDIWALYLFPNVRGKYIALCDGDDYWTDPLKLQKQVDIMEQNSEIGLVYTQVKAFDNNGVVGPKALIGAFVHVSSLAFIGQASVLVPRKVKDVGSNALVGAGAVVTKSVEECHVVVGQPAKTIKILKND